MQAVNLLWKGLTILPTRLIEQGPRRTSLWLYEKVARMWYGVSPIETTQVTDKVFVGGQQYRRGLDRMRAWGIGATLNLREESDDAAKGVALEDHIWLPTPDDGAPTLEQLSEGIAFIRASLKKGQGVYIHCAQGVGRAPTMAAAYLMSEGATPQAALDKIREVRPFINPTPVQYERLREWQQVLANAKTTADY